MVAQQATWGIAPSVRRALARMVLEMRATLEDDFTRQLAAFGIRENGVQPAGRPLTPHDQRSHDTVVAAVRREVEGGASHVAALKSYVREAAFTFLNRIVGLRCMEERGLLIVDGQPETAIKILPAFNAPSLYWRVRNESSTSASPREVWSETLRRACAAVSQQVRVLFDTDSEYTALLPLQPTLQKIMEAFNSPDIPPEIYAQDETLGWVYQYYNQQEKDQVYEQLGKGKKIERPEELAAATCLYTERYMVDYLLQNTLGALWVEIHPDSRVPGQWPYYVRPPEGNPKPQRPASRVREITVMDPACGSGHFLVRAFDLLAQMYAEEGLERPEEIAHLILERNLHGIDIDLRAVQIAALALYLKGCALAGPGFRPRQLNLIPADAVLPGDTPPKDYMKRFKGDAEIEALVTGIWQGLRNVREFGSLLHPERAVDDVVRKRAQVDQGKFPILQRGDQWKTELMHGLREEFEKQSKSEDLGQRLFGEEAAKGVSLVEALGSHYDVVVTNPPYAGSKNLNLRLKAFLEKEYKEGKRDLYAAFILRCRDFCRTDGYVGMVTQQSWMFLRSFAALRKKVLEWTTLSTLAQLGSGAFEEIGGEVVNIALFTLRTASASNKHRLTGFRLVGPKSTVEKAALLCKGIAGKAPSVVSTPLQADFMHIPDSPFVYWLRPRFLELFRESPRLGTMVTVRDGISSGDTDRVLRYHWGILSSNHWRWHEKGGGFSKWSGLSHHVIDWSGDGEVVREQKGGFIRNPGFFGRPGLIYSRFARGSLGARVFQGFSFDTATRAVFPLDNSVDIFHLIAILNTRTTSYFLRLLVQGFDFSGGYTEDIPVWSGSDKAVSLLSSVCISLKNRLLSVDPIERGFILAPPPSPTNIQNLQCLQALLCSCEGIIEHRVFSGYLISGDDQKAILDETGTPAGWYPIVVGYDAVPESSLDITVPKDLFTDLEENPRRTLQSEELSHLKDRLRALYQAGPGVMVEEGGNENTEEGEEESDVALGARIVIPTETFLEELSHKLEIHPISVYWLLKEMREQESLVCPLELKRHLEDYVSITVLRLLGYRWPEQDKYEREHGPIIDPSLLVEDGIIPLVPCGDQPTAADRVRRRLERDFGDEGASQSEAEFRQWVGRSIEDWLKRDFFRHHVQQFKQRPIAWHLVSPERTIEVFVLYHKLSRATLQKLRAQYAGGLIVRLQAEQARARSRGDAANVSRLQIQIEDVEEFRSRVEAIERSEELQYRIRCRWKGEEDTGRPGPYAPDIDDGVKVNIRPFQEAGLLAVKEVIKKW